MVANADSIRGQQAQLCPFLTRVKKSDQECIKPTNAKGVCTISSASNGARQDWVTCPYRGFDPALMRGIASDLYGYSQNRINFVPSLSLAEPGAADALFARFDAGDRNIAYFDDKTGGEIQVGATTASPQIKFDTTLVELLRDGRGLRLGRFAIVEIQTMDFHGTYKHAVKNLQDALRLHAGSFPQMVRGNPAWLSQGIEGPNIANVFKRTYYQLLFKFEIARMPTCAGTAIAIPLSVWDSWQRFLGAPTLQAGPNGTWVLPDPASKKPKKKVGPSWIYVFEPDSGDARTPNQLVVRKAIRVGAEALAHYATDVAPEHAMEEISRGLYPMLRRRLNEFLSRSGVEVE